MTEELRAPTEEADREGAGADVDEIHQPSEQSPPPPVDEPDRRRATWLAPVALALLVIASTAFAASLFYFQYLPDRKTDDVAASGALSAASDSTVAILSYAPDSLDKDFSTAKSRLTGEFLDYYGKFTEQIVGPAAKQKAVKTTATIAQAAVSEIHPDSAVVLVFVNQTTQSAERPDPSITASSVLVSLKKIDGAWLVSAFNPI
jgi:Mce-associated membrane protein